MPPRQETCLEANRRVVASWSFEPRSRPVRSTRSGRPFWTRSVDRSRRGREGLRWDGHLRGQVEGGRFLGDGDVSVATSSPVGHQVRERDVCITGEGCCIHRPELDASSCVMSHDDRVGACQVNFCSGLRIAVCLSTVYVFVKK